MRSAAVILQYENGFEFHDQQLILWVVRWIIVMLLYEFSSVVIMIKVMILVHG